MNWRHIIGAILLLLVVVFTLQNAAVVSIAFLFWKLEISRVLIIFFVLGIGFIIGWITASLKQHESDE
jgi:uncharacterized integral membrane protein